MCISAERRVITKTKRRRAMMMAARKQMSPEQRVSSAPKDELLQACLRYDWDQVEHWCNLLSSCTEDNHKTADLVKEQLLQKDPWGNTPLHAACHYNPPLPVVHSLLQLTKKTGICSQLCTLRNTNGAVPVVVACLTGGASLPVLLLLLRELQSKDQLRDHQGNSAIGGLLDRYQMLRKVPKFAHSMQALEDISSLHDSSRMMETKEPLRMMHHLIVDDMTAGGFDQCWIKMQALLQTAWKLEFDGSLKGWTPLHGAANLASQIPPSLAKLLIRCYSQLVSKPVNGLLPLHMALQEGKGAAIFCQELIRAGPSTAKCPHPTTKQLPLVQAMGRFSWDTTTNTDESVAQCILQQLWKAYPEALDQPDSKTGLYPAFLAGTMKTAKVDQHQLDTVFHMLRLNPSIVTGS